MPARRGGGVRALAMTAPNGLAATLSVRKGMIKMTPNEANKIGADPAAAISANDSGQLRRLYASDAVIWHKTDGLEIGLD